MFRNIGIVSAVSSKAIEKAVLEVLAIISKKSCKAYLDNRIILSNASADLQVLPVSELSEICDLIISIGGDGTLLQCATLTYPHEVALLGINLGRLGFLADLPPDNLKADLGAILEGDFVTENRSVLGCQVIRSEEIIASCHGLNDIVIQKWNSARLITLNTYVNSKFLHSQRGDGMIVATPTGSTAYAMSGGGPILDPEIKALALVPICPHTLTNRPIVISDEAVIEIRVATERDDQARLTCDGNSIHDLLRGDKIFISRKAKAIKLAHPSKNNHYATLRAKLNWALDPC
jgi:NAD+ kinase